jgi:hypothetical protein
MAKRISKGCCGSSAMHIRDDVTQAGAGVAFEHDEVPRRELLVVGNTRGDAQHGLALLGRRTRGQ